MYYLIKTGNHYCEQSKISLTFKKKLTYYVQFNETAQQETDDLNKLFGFSDCWSHHHRNSARIAWRWNDTLGVIEIFAYTYVEGKRNMEWICNVKINENIRCTIECNENVYRFYIGSVYHTVSRKDVSNFSLRYKLFPYFGGDDPAPRSVTIWMNEIKRKKR